MAPVLVVENLTKKFHPKRRFFFLKSHNSSFTAVDNISFHLKEGEILGILGSNGAGKTTTIEMLLGVLTPTSGRILYFEKDFFKSISETLQYVGHASPYNKLATFLTIQENLEIIGRLYSIPYYEIKKRIDRLLEHFGMDTFRYKQAGSLSAGQLTRVMLIKAFLSYPRIVLLDEPTASLDPDIALEVRSFIKSQQNEYGVSIILTSHNMQEVAEVCNRVLVLQGGKIIQEDTPEKLAKSVAVTEVTFTNLQNVEKLIPLLQKQEWIFRMLEKKMIFDLDENDVPYLLNLFGQEGVTYTHIEIEKPTLEDYFLYISRLQAEKEAEKWS